MHSLKNLKFIEVSQFVGVQMSGLLPSRTASYPLLPIVPARLCGSGHLSTGKTLNSLKTCLHSQCGSPFTSSCVAQIAGRTKCLLNQAIPENPSIQFFKDYLNSYSENASSVPVETQESTRKSRAVDTLFDVNSIIESVGWDEDRIVEFHSIANEGFIQKQIFFLCKFAKLNLYHSNVLRILLGNGSDKFQFHQEFQSTDNCCKTISGYISCCLFFKDSVDLKHFVYITETAILQLAKLKMLYECLPDDLDPEEPCEIFQNLVIDFLLGQLHQPVLATMPTYKIGVIQYLIFKNITKDKVFKEANTVTRMFSHFEYVLKVFLGIRALKMDSETNSPSSTKAWITKNYTENDVFQAIISIHASFASAASKEQRHPIFLDEGGHLIYAGKRIDHSTIQNFASAHFRLCQTLMESIFANFPLLDIPDSLKDDPRCKQDGTCLYTQNKHFILHTGESMEQKWKNLAAHIVHSHKLKSRDSINIQALQSFMETKFQKVSLLLMVLLHISGGSPARRTELATIRIANEKESMRNVFLNGNFFYYAITYKKISQRTDNWTPVYRFLPAIVSKLLFNYICLLRPALSSIQRFCDSTFVLTRKLYQVQNENEPTEISDQFQRSFAESTGISLLFSEWRHLVQIFLRREIAEQILQRTEAEVIDTQSGRSSLTGILHYGIGSQIISGTTIDQQSRERQLSLKWHFKSELEANR